MISTGRGAACHPAPALCSPHRLKPPSPGRSPPLLSTGPPLDINRLHWTTWQALNSQSLCAFADALTALLLSKSRLSRQRCSWLYGWKPTLRALPADPPAAAGTCQTSRGAGAGLAGNRCAQHGRYHAKLNTWKFWCPAVSVQQAGNSHTPTNAGWPCCCLTTHQRNWLPGWDRDSEVAEIALSWRSRLGSQRCWLCFPRATNIPLLLAALASAIRGEKQSAPSPAAEDIKPAFSGCHFYGESFYHKTTESRSNCWRHKTRLLLATKGCSPMRCFFTTFNSMLDKSNYVERQGDAMGWWYHTTNPPTNQPWRSRRRLRTCEQSRV